MLAPGDVKAERDALVFLGLLAHVYLKWDPPMPLPPSHGKRDYTHFTGLNIHALVIDNVDGEVLSLERNRIHEHEDPTCHAEPAAIQAALERLHAKRPRPREISVEQYYRTQLFYAPDRISDACVDKGCTLYTTLEPCPMCASRLCVARMKRTAYLIQDQRFGGAFPCLLARFYPMFELEYGPCTIAGASVAAQMATPIANALEQGVIALRAQGAQDTWFLDSLSALIQNALTALMAIQAADIVDPRNQRTLSDLKRRCRVPG